MAYRFSLNNITASTASTQYFLWYIYSFMTKTSPNGPGWVSVGEGNGTTGGMGTTGLFTSATSLASQYSWFVLRSPDSKMYLLCSRTTTTVYNAKYALSIEPMTGGSATVNPTYTTAKTLIFGDGATLSSTTYRYNICLAANDIYPYDFYALNFNINLNSLASTPTNYDCLSIIPVYNYDVSDGYPWVFSKSNFGYGAIDVLTDTTYGTKAFNFDGSLTAVCPPLSLNAYTTSLSNRLVGPAYTQTYAIPLIFSNTSFYKGMSNIYGWVPTPMTIGRTLNNKQQIVLRNVIVPWDGLTTPILNAN